MNNKLLTMLGLLSLIVMVGGCGNPAATTTDIPPTITPESLGPTETASEAGKPTEDIAEPTTEATQEGSSTATPATSRQEFPVESLRAAILGDESTINPYTYVTGSPGWNLLMMQYDSLFTFDVSGEAQPWLVREYELSDDKLSYELSLRDDVTWHDGSKFTAEDVKFTFEYYSMHGEGRFARDIADFESAEVSGDHQVTINLSSVDPTFIRTALADVPILPKHVWEDIQDPINRQWDIDANVGTGPYQLVDYQPDQFYRFEANEDYFAGTPTVGELLVVRMADLSSALAAFRAREIDVLFRSIPAEQRDLLSGIDGVEIAQGPQFGTQLLVFDVQRAPFDRVGVRRAIALALDRQDMVETVFLEAATKGSSGWIHPDQTVFNDNLETEHDPERSRELLGEAGITDNDGDGVRDYEGTPMSFELVTPSNNALRLRLAELVKGMLQEIGIDVQVASVEQTTWEDAVWPGFDITNGRNYELAMWGWSAPTLATPSKVCWLIHSDPAVGFLNITGFENAEADELCNDLRASSDPDERAALIKDIQQVIADQVPFVVLLYPDGLFAYWGEVHDDYAFIAGQGIVNKLSFLPQTARP